MSSSYPPLLNQNYNATSKTGCPTSAALKADARQWQDNTKGQKSPRILTTLNRWLVLGVLAAVIVGGRKVIRFFVPKTWSLRFGAGSN